MKITIELKGAVDEKHCSLCSSIRRCQFLNTGLELCNVFHKKLKYDWDNHAYARCEECINNEIASN